ncbi:hypothetical protein [Jannaschia sp. W003]|uniref:hypothetical protein n=1 Tax=Jannaschia sp. W003 TaxID=2867012 RepID=UPI0021A601EC|nr:hypothetical protein [Jannaschia sp. W003]UWQ20235.1 hypothetical protein K3554_09495 [Jannaschia sp. W003]
MSWLAAMLGGAILLVLVVRAWWIMRAEDGERPRGVDPGAGYTELRSEYFSGVGGGSDQTTRVPRDPQEYARAFVPRKDRT